ncbi:hypothetical protein PAP_08050 [Palaeococcus pacificus DY20341]|uniref:Nudix hydrolase domain-containing protein n=1 Tax=Palaeococcus pacificus DY20341 TaxID=1343739 RepID=A0A075LZH8_9EURY|nr:NUDIX hydrolase [Palaeococcus pacificus]AIF69998.1 hypothetical protein PAP_08050 [Palaeococcus pacificus DY20341]
MERYTFLVKVPKGYDIEEISREVRAFVEEHFGDEVEITAHKCIGLTVDLVIVYNGGIVLIKRRNYPYKDHWALPGGFVEYGERVEDAAVREAKEETGLNVELLGLVGVYSDPHRDPRGHTVTTAFLAVGRGELKGGDDAKEARVFTFQELKEIPLAFDHAEIINDALKLLEENNAKKLISSLR